MRINFKKIHFTNAENIPWDKPIIFAANHPTSFIEPCILATHLKHPLYFLARGDLFKKPFYIKALNSFHILPIYRLKDGGYGKIKNNYSTFDKCFEALRENKNILIMAEGRCIQEKRLRPIQKGAARLAFGTYEKFGDLDVVIIPIGVNYTYASKFRSEVMIDFGQPIEVKNYIESYDEDTHVATRDITSDLEKHLLERVIVIEKEADEALVEDLFCITRNNENQSIFPIVTKEIAPLKTEMKIAHKVNNLSDDAKSNLKNLIKDYQLKIDEAGISDWGLLHHNSTSFLGWLFLVIFFIPFLVGYLLNYLPMRYGKYIVDTKVKELEDKMSVGIAITIAAYLLYWLLIIFSAIFFNITLSFVIILIMIPFGYFSILYKEYFYRWRQANQSRGVDKILKKDLLNLRNNILKSLD